MKWEVWCSNLDLLPQLQWKLFRVRISLKKSEMATVIYFLEIRDCAYKLCPFQDWKKKKKLCALQGNQDISQCSFFFGGGGASLGENKQLKGGESKIFPLNNNLESEPEILEIYAFSCRPHLCVPLDVGHISPHECEWIPLFILSFTQ